MMDMIKRVTRPTLALAFLFSATPLHAWGGDVSETREVYRDNLSVRMANGQLGRALLEFTVTATAYVGQRGNARWPDDRACYYDSVRRTLVRTLVFTAPDGTTIPVRDTTVALPSLSGRSWSSVTTCNDKINEIQNTLKSATGNAETWQSYIDGEKAEARKILSQFGQVT